MPKLREVIEHYEHRGCGTDKDPHRMVYQIWSTDGQLLAESDPHHHADDRWKLVCQDCENLAMQCGHCAARAKVEE